MPLCVCRKVKDMGPFFQLQVNEMNEKMSFKMGVKFAVPFYMGRIFLIYCMNLKLEAKVLRLNYKYKEDRPN